MMMAVSSFKSSGYSENLPKMAILVILVHWLLCGVPCEGVYRSSRVVTTKYGALRGLVVKPNNRELSEVEMFLGVPYASPPVGTFRFMPPTSSVKWEGVRKADTMPPVCPQKLPDVSNRREALKMMPIGRYNYLQKLLPMLRNQSEDCLYLNIYAPIRDKYQGRGLLPVLVYIHGESYEWNSGNPYDGTVLASYGQVLVVTINFRLGILGFLRPALSEKQVSNFGLLDQIAALLWIRGNIEKFGGDPNNVSLFGHGTGAALTNLLLVSPVAQPGKGAGLFKRAILMSGSALSTWAISWQPYKYTIEVAQAVKCPLVSGTDDFVNCLRSKTVEELLAVSLPHPPFTTALGPILDDKVIKQQSVSQMKIDLDIFSKYDLLFGVTSAESFNMLNAREVKFGMSEERKKRLLRTYISNTFEHQTNMIYATVANEYKSWSTTSQFPGKRKELQTRDETLEILSDAQIVAPVVKMGDIHSELNSKSYFYVFNHQSIRGEYPINQGTVHGEELPYVFGAPLVGGFSHFGVNYTHEEKFLSELVMTMWTNFAKTGNPNLPTPQGYKTPGSNFNWNENLKRLWPPYDRISQQYLHIDMQVVTKLHYRPKKLGVWNDFIPRIIRSSEMPLVMPPKSTVISFMPTQSPYHNPFMPVTQKTKYKPVPVDSIPNPTYVSKYQPSIIPSGADISLSPESSVDGPPVSVGTPISVIILIGVCILLFNCLAVAGIYYHKDRKRKKAQSRTGSTADSLNLEEAPSKKTKSLSSKNASSTVSLNSKDSDGAVSSSSRNGTLRRKNLTGSQVRISVQDETSPNRKSPYGHRRYKSENSLYHEVNAQDGEEIKYKKGQSVKFYNSGSLPSKSMTKSSSSIASMRSTTSKGSIKSGTSRTSVKSTSSVKPIKKNASCQSLPTPEYSWGITKEMTMFKDDGDVDKEDEQEHDTQMYPTYPSGSLQINGRGNGQRVKPFPPMRSTSLTMKEIEALEKMKAFYPIKPPLQKNVSVDSKAFDNIESFYGMGSGEAPVSPSAMNIESSLPEPSAPLIQSTSTTRGFDYPPIFNPMKYSPVTSGIVITSSAPVLPQKKGAHINLQTSSGLFTSYPRPPIFSKPSWTLSGSPDDSISVLPITPKSEAVVSAAAHSALAAGTAPVFVGSNNSNPEASTHRAFPSTFDKTPPAIAYDIEGVKKKAIVASAKAKGDTPTLEKPLKSVLKQTSAYDKPKTQTSDSSLSTGTNVTQSTVPSGSSSPSSNCSPEDGPETFKASSNKRKTKTQKKGKS